jgi:Flp pilus assembly pilin Flp
VGAIERRFDEVGERAMQSSIAVVALRRIANARFRTEEEGQDLLEYGLLVALIALLAIGAVASVGNAVYTFFWQSIANNF